MPVNNHIMFSSIFRKKSVDKFPLPEVQSVIPTDIDNLQETVYDFIRTIKDPEKPNTLEELNVVYEDGVQLMTPTPGNVSTIRVEFNPTVPHCSLATLIGLCIRVKIERNIPHLLKLDIFIKKGAHATEDESMYKWYNGDI